MSWNLYIDNLIEQSKDDSGTYHADRAFIFSLDGGAFWTTPTQPNIMQPSEQETANIARCFKTKDFNPLQSSGVIIENIKYQFLGVEGGKVVVARKKDMGGISLQASNTAVVVAHTPEGCQTGNTNKAVEVIADYLESLGM